MDAKQRAAEAYTSWLKNQHVVCNDLGVLADGVEDEMIMAAYCAGHRNRSEEDERRLYGFDATPGDYQYAEEMALNWMYGNGVDSRGADFDNQRDAYAASFLWFMERLQIHAPAEDAV